MSEGRPVPEAILVRIAHALRASERTHLPVASLDADEDVGGAPSTPYRREVAAAGAALSTLEAPERVARLLVVAFDADPEAVRALLSHLAAVADETLPETERRTTARPR